MKRYRILNFKYTEEKFGVVLGLIEENGIDIDLYEE